MAGVGSAPTAPRLDHVREATRHAVLGYKKHTLVVKDFLKAHRLEVSRWEDWDVAPFVVLNIRKGNPIPVDILHALDSAIWGREDVTRQFTEANMNPRMLYEASDINHRVFIEKLRHLRRVWFPNVPEAVVTAPVSTTLGQVKLMQMTTRSGKNPFGARENEDLQLEETAADGVATVPDHNRGSSKKRKRDSESDESTKKGKTSKRRKLASARAAVLMEAVSMRMHQKEDPEETQNSPESESGPDGAASTSSLALPTEQPEQPAAESVFTSLFRSARKWFSF